MVRVRREFWHGCAQKDSDKARTYSERVPDSSIRVIAPHVIDSGAVSSCYIRYGVVFSPQTYLVASVLGWGLKMSGVSLWLDECGLDFGVHATFSRALTLRRPDSTQADAFPQAPALSFPYSYKSVSILTKGIKGLVSCVCQG